jgi:protein-S-isoprenylcysteine O-methyltransferase Ste14
MKELLFKLRSYTPIPFLLWGLWLLEFNWTSFAAGLTLVVAGELLRLWAVGHAGSLTRTRNVGADRLVTTGPYAFVRNPLYTGNMLIYCGMVLAMSPSWPWLLLLVFIWFLWQYTLIVQLEEGKLITLFGDEYEQYRKHVPRIIPRLMPWRVEGEDTKSTMDWKRAFRSERRTQEAILVTVLLIFIVRNWHVCSGF